MSRILGEKIEKLKFEGGVDADGHILEAADLWEKYCEPKYRETALRMKVDEKGLDYMEIGGRPSRVNRGGNFASLGLMGQVTRETGEFNPKLHYGDECLLGAMDAKQRLQRLDMEGLEAAIIYPSIGLAWERLPEPRHPAPFPTREPHAGSSCRNTDFAY